MPKAVKRHIRLLVIVASIASIAASLWIAVSIARFLIGSSVHGAALEQRDRQAIAAAGASGACQPQAGTPAPGKGGAAAQSTGEGLLEAPALGLVAPVLQGTSDSVLAEAVGHDPASTWPGSHGTSVLSAHDVTWFSSIGKLKAGDVIQYVTPCTTYLYRVTAHKIVRAGSPVYNSTTGQVVLDTCYPFNALYLTPNRYLVYATFTAAQPTHPRSTASPVAAAPHVPAPPALAAQGLTLSANNAPLGSLTLAGTPAAAWRQSSAPLNDEAAALAAYFGVVRSAEAGQRSWWADLAPAVPAAAAGPLWDGRLTGYDSSVDITLDVSGTTPVGATITAVISAGNAGRHRLAVTERVQNGDILVTQFKLTG